MLAKSRQPFVIVSVRSMPKKNVFDTYLMAITLPHGLALESGAEIVIDQNPVHKIAIFTSDAQGVYARTGLTERLLASLKTGTKMTSNLWRAMKERSLFP